MLNPMGEGSLEIYNPATGEVIERSENSNVILDQGILGLSGDPTGTQWAAWNQWKIQVGTGSRNHPEATYITGLDTPLWTSSSINTTYAKQTDDAGFTVIAEIEPTEANGDLIEACIFSNKAFNRLMFKSPGVLPAGSYEYLVINQVGSGPSALYSSPSNIRPVFTTEAGATLLEWRQNYTGVVDKYHLYRKAPGDSTFRLLRLTNSTFFVDAGFVAAGGNLSLAFSASIPSPTLATVGFNTLPHPKARTKTADFAARIKISISFQL